MRVLRHSVALAVLCALGLLTGSHAAFNYGKLTQPEGFSGLCTLGPPGATQSPINIPLKPDISDLHTKVCKGARCTRTPKLPACSGSGLGPLKPILQAGVTAKVNNTGHSLQVNTPAGAGIVKVGGKTLQLLQFHWHRASEHTFDGQHEAMELHLVMNNTANGEIAVLATLLKAGATSCAPRHAGGVAPRVNKPLQTALETAPLTERKAGQTLPSAKFNLHELLPAPESDGRRPYVHYNGSLTTPPCTESVDWYIMGNMLPVEASQVLHYEDIMAAAGNVFGHTARPIQPTDGRKLDYCEWS